MSNDAPDLDQVKQAIQAARDAERHLLDLDRNAVQHDDGHPIMAPSDDERAIRSHVRTHGRHSPSA